jgi:hypothetical protein
MKEKLKNVFGVKVKNMNREEEFEDMDDRDLPPGMGGIFEQPFIVLDNELMIRKDFIVGVKKINDFETQTYSIIVYHESLESDVDPNMPEYLSMQFGGQIEKFHCYKCPLPEERDERFEEIKLQLNVI